MFRIIGITRSENAMNAGLHAPIMVERTGADAMDGTSAVDPHIDTAA
ncbi:Uncharacterised protein [Bordetella pertussis]|nr:Uncharacterised protein [Bordetella pertussis]